jgi:hypothetical protein
MAGEDRQGRGDAPAVLRQADGRVTGSLLLTTWNRVEPDPAQCNADWDCSRSIDGHRRADDVDRGGCDGGRALTQVSSRQSAIFKKGVGVMCRHRNGCEVINGCDAKFDARNPSLLRVANLIASGTPLKFVQKNAVATPVPVAPP